MNVYYICEFKLIIIYGLLSFLQFTAEYRCSIIFVLVFQTEIVDFAMNNTRFIFRSKSEWFLLVAADCRPLILIFWILTTLAALKKQFSCYNQVCILMYIAQLNIFYYQYVLHLKKIISFRNFQKFQTILENCYTNCIIFFSMWLIVCILF